MRSPPRVFEGATDGQNRVRLDADSPARAAQRDGPCRARRGGLFPGQLGGQLK